MNNSQTLKNQQKHILDTSAVIALLKKEEGYKIVDDIIANSAISSVNISELVAVLARSQVSDEDIDAILTDLVLEVIPLSQEIGITTGKLSRVTQKYGLSLGDRACIATGIHLSLPIYTTDEAWEKLNFKGTKIVTIR